MLTFKKWAMSWKNVYANIPASDETVHPRSLTRRFTNYLKFYQGSQMILKELLKNQLNQDEGLEKNIFCTCSSFFFTKPRNTVVSDKTNTHNQS